MAIDFPASPTNGQTFTSGSVAYTWDGTKWTAVAAAGSSNSISQGNTNATVTDTGSDGRFVVTTEGTERARIDSSGRLLVGTSSTSGNATLHVNKGSAAGTDAGGLLLTNMAAMSSIGAGDDLGYINFGATTTGGVASYDAARILCEADATWGTNDYPSRLVFSTTADGASSPTERMRINASGQTLIGKTSDTLSTPGWAIDGGSTIGRGQLTCGSTGAPILRLNHTGGAGTEYAVETWKNGTQVGSISVTASATAYTTSSDYRLKENVIPVTDGIARLQQLKPSRFNFIADADKTVDGFIAHEVQTIVPEAITGEKDAVDDDGNPVYQGIDQSKLVPLLTAALQEAVAKIESLEARLTAAGI